MGLFSRRPREPKPFWREPPIRSTDPAAFHQHGIWCISQGDGRGAIATGWSIWQLAGLHEFQAWDFLYDGYKAWRTSSTFDRALAQRFLADLLDELGEPPVAPWPDLHAVDRADVEPIAAVHSAICWAASEILEVAGNGELEQWQRRAYAAIAGTRHEFVPPRSMSFAVDYASAQGLQPPW